MIPGAQFSNVQLFKIQSHQKNIKTAKTYAFAASGCNYKILKIIFERKHCVE